MTGVIRPLAAVLVPLLPLAAQAPSEVVGARHLSGSEAVYSSARGLVLRAPARADLALGTAGEARFDAAGGLWFVRSVDAGHEEVARSWWVLPAGAATPRAARPGERPPAPAGAPDTDSPTVRVCIDAGHGGSDPGALGNGLREADVNLDVALRLQTLLARDSQDPSRGGVWNVLLTRTADVYVSLSQRTSAANAFGAASFVSIHMNAFSSSSANGTETYCYTGAASGPSGALRNEVHAEALAAWQLTNRGVKTANFYVLRNTRMPATLLEGGFITNAGDAQKLGDPNARQRLALGVLFALQRHHGFSVWDPGSGTPTGELRGVVYDRSRGPTAPIQGALVALQDGTFTTTDASGAFSFTLPAGPVYRYAATATGFDPAHDARAIPVGGASTGSLGLLPADVPAFAMTPVEPTPGGPLVLRAATDPSTMAVAVVSTAPGIPPLDVRALGLGYAWPDLAFSLSLPIGIGNALGFTSTSVTTPRVPGLILHAQALVTHGGNLRLTNGAAVRVR